MNQTQIPYQNLPYHNDVDTSNADVEALAAPGAHFQYFIYWLKINVKTADDITTKSGTTVKDVNYLGDTAGVIIDYGDKPMKLGENEALNLTKGSAGTDMSYAVRYLVVPI